MRGVTVALLLSGLALGLLAGAPGLVTLAPRSAVLVRASSTAFPCPSPFGCNYSDPANDVAELWTANGTHVTTAGGYWIFVTNRSSIDLVRLSSSNASADINIFLDVKAMRVDTSANTTFQWRLYTRADNSTHYIVTYHAGITTMTTNKTGSTSWNLTASTRVENLGWLAVAVPKADLGGPANITAWNIDASSKMVQGSYTYEDFVWQLPGNPGSAPAAIQGHVTDAASGSGLAGVNVSAAGYWTSTNATGYYLLPATVGNLSVSFTLMGYVTVVKPVSVSTSQTVTVDAALTKASQAGLPASTWVVLAVVGVAVVGAVVLIAARRRKPKPPADVSDQGGDRKP